MPDHPLLPSQRAALNALFVDIAAPRFGDAARTHLAFILTRARHLHGWDQQTVADRARIQRADLSRYENGKTIPRDGTLKRLGRVLFPDADKTQAARLLALGDRARWKVMAKV